MRGSQGAHGHPRAGGAVLRRTAPGAGLPGPRAARRVSAGYGIIVRVTRRLMLLDTASLYFRAFYGVPDSVRAPDGTPVNAVRGLMDFIARLVQDHRPDDLVACWDNDWRPQWRVDLIPSYKAHRVAAEQPGAPDVEETPDALEAQVPVIREVLAAVGIARVGADGYEADDVIGTLTARAEGPVDIVTGDRDLFQLVDDARRRRVLYPLKGVGTLQVTDEEWLRARYGVDGSGYADLALLRGDPSDGLPGVPGIGEKTAAKLLDAYGDLAGILAAAGDRTSALTPTQRRRLEEARPYLAVAPTVVGVARDVPLPEFDPALPAAPRDPAALEALAARWGLGGAVVRLLSALEG